MNHLDPQTKEKVLEVLGKALVCHVAFSESDQPYVLPLSFGFLENALYFHAASKGKKLDILAKNPRVAFSIEESVVLKEAQTACKYSMLYKSVVGSGKAVLVEDVQEKADGLNIVVRHYNAEPLEYSEKSLNGLSVFRIDIEEISYKETTTS